MLVLTRRNQESIRINDDIRIVIIQTKNGGVWLGIEAPDHVRIDREEIWQRRREFASHGTAGPTNLCDS